jgi:hypothetical protein
VSSVSNGLYFLTIPLVSVMCIIYTSKGMSKKFGVRVIHKVRVICRKIGYLVGIKNLTSRNVLGWDLMNLQLTSLPINEHLFS